MKYLPYVIALLLSVTLFAQEGVKTIRSGTDTTEDTPSPPVKVIIPASVNLPSSSYIGEELDNPRIPEELTDEPATELVDGPKFFGQPISGRFVWCLDRSGSMAAQDANCPVLEDKNGSVIVSPTRWQRVRFEVTNALKELAVDDEFAIVSFGH